jgi:hypothetical protein
MNKKNIGRAGAHTRAELGGLVSMPAELPDGRIAAPCGEVSQ